MARVFQTAYKTLIWLGPSDYTTNNMFEGFEVLAKSDYGALDVYEDMDIGNPESLRMVGLMDVYDQPYFKRLWTFQEVCLSRELECHVGSRCIRWDVFAKASQWYLERLRTEPTAPIFAIDGIVFVQTVCDFQKGRIMPMFWYMSFARDHAVSDERDKLFALLGVLSFTLAGDEVPPRLRPDYTLPVQRVYRLATEAMIMEDERLHALGEVDHQYDYSNEASFKAFPSWVPQWDRSRVCAPLPSSTFFADGKQRVSPDSFSARSTKRSHLHVPFACHVDEVDSSWQVYGLDDFETLAATCRHLRQIYLESRLSTLASAMEVLHTLSVDHTTSSALTHKEWDDVAAGVGCCCRLEHWSSSVSGVDSILKHSSLAPSRDSNLDAFSISISRYANHRRIFTTSKGRIGIGPETMDRDDMVAILPGGDWPFILRRPGVVDSDASDGADDPSELNVVFVGHCYVHGIMYGEALQDPSLVRRTFNIV